MNIIFFGSDDFALSHLEKLLTSKNEIVCCVTPLDKPKGRGMHLESSPIKKCAEENKIQVLQPKEINEEFFISKLKEFNSDLFVVIAYGKILPKDILEIPKLFPVNVHASLLPKYRGAAPINWAILNGEKETGISIIKMNEKMDAGEVVSKVKINIEENDTSFSLRERMKVVGPELLVETLTDIETGKYNLEKQDEGKVSTAVKLTKDLGLIKWNKPAKDIINKVRGLIPWPCAYTNFKDKFLKILECQITDIDIGGAYAGEVIDVSKQGLTIAVADKAVLIKKVHLQDSKEMDAHSFIIGHKVEKGYCFN